MLTSDHIRTRKNLQTFSEPMIGNDLYTHAVRYDDQIDQILTNGIKPGKNGWVSSTQTTVPKGGQIDRFGVRNIGSGYVVFRAPEVGIDDIDVISSNERYPETRFKYVAPENIVKVVRVVNVDGFRIREDDLARVILQNPNHEDVKYLPEKYKRWTLLEVKEFVRLVVEAKKLDTGPFKVGDQVLFGKYKNKKGKIVDAYLDDKDHQTIEIEPVPKGRKKNVTMGLYKVWAPDEPFEEPEDD